MNGSGPPAPARAKSPIGSLECGRVLASTVGGVRGVGATVTGTGGVLGGLIVPWLAGCDDGTEAVTPGTALWAVAGAVAGTGAPGRAAPALPANGPFGSQFWFLRASASSCSAPPRWVLVMNGIGTLVTYTAMPRATPRPITSPTIRPMTVLPLCLCFMCGSSESHLSRRA